MAVPSFGAATTMPSEANDEPAAAGGGKNVVHNKQGIDMLHGRIWTKVLRFALPVAATGILEQLFNASGIMIVGNFSQSDGTAAVAAVGSNAPVTGLILNLFIGIALGANVVIANAIGRGSREAVRNAVHTSIVTALIGGVIVAIIGELLAGPLLGMLNVTADVFPLALAYLRIYLIGMPVILLYNFETAIFRSIGDTQAPLAVLAISGVLNVTMGLIFVVLFHWGVSGVATATVIANVVSSMILLYRLVHTDAAIHVDLREFGIDWFTLRQILRIGLPPACKARCSPWPTSSSKPPSTVSAPLSWRLQRRVQHRNHRLLRAQLVQPGLRHLHRAKLWSQTDRTLQARAWHLHSGGFHRHRGHHRRRAVLRP